MYSSRDGPALSSSIDRAPARFRPSTTPSVSMSASRRMVRGRVGGASLSVLSHTDTSSAAMSPKKSGAGSDDDDDSVIVDEVLTSAEPSPEKRRIPARPIPAEAPEAAADSPLGPKQGSTYSTDFDDDAPAPLPQSKPSTLPSDAAARPTLNEAAVTSEATSTPPSAPAKPVISSSPEPASPAAASASTVNVPAAEVPSEAAPSPSTAEPSPAVRPPARASETSISVPDLPRRPMSSTAGNRPRHISLGRKELLGKGTFGMVYRAMDLDTNRIIAVKEVTIAPGTMRPEQLATLRREINMIQKLDHPNIVKYLGEHWDGQQHLRIFMEYVAGGTVSSLLRSFGPATEQQASRYARQMLEGLRYLHEQRIAHRDLKGDNLLVDVDGTLKLADFGTAKELATRTKSVAGTAFFMAPEVIRGVGHGIEADIWSAGCCVIEMLSGKPPFANFSNQYAIMMHIAEIKDGAFPLPPAVSPLCKDFLERCLRPDPSLRATVSDLLAHEWIVNPPHSTDLHSINMLSASDNTLGDEPDTQRRGHSPDERRADSFNPIQSYGPESPTAV